jgi:hypothetical protein
MATERGRWELEGRERQLGRRKVEGGREGVRKVVQGRGLELEEGTKRRKEEEGRWKEVNGR